FARGDVLCPTRLHVLEVVVNEVLLVRLRPVGEAPARLVLAEQVGERCLRRRRDPRLTESRKDALALAASVGDRVRREGLHPPAARLRTLEAGDVAVVAHVEPGNRPSARVARTRSLALHMLFLLISRERLPPRTIDHRGGVWSGCQLLLPRREPVEVLAAKQPTPTDRS